MIRISGYDLKILKIIQIDLYQQEYGSSTAVTILDMLLYYIPNITTAAPKLKMGRSNFKKAPREKYG